MFPSVFFYYSKDLEQLHCLSTDEWITKVKWNITQPKDEAKISKQMDLGYIILNIPSQKKEIACSISSSESSN